MGTLALSGSARAAVFLTITNGYAAPLGYGGLRDGWVNGEPTGTSVYAGTLGFKFLVLGDDILVTSLGYYDGPNSAAANVSGYTADGLLNSHAVGIWDGSGTLVAYAVVPTSGTSVIGDFQFISIAPVTLPGGGASYTLGGLVTTADEAGTGDVFFDAGGNTAISTDPAMLVLDGPYSPVDGDTLQLPSLPGPGYIGGNFQFQSVPEPSSVLTLLFVGGAALAARRRSTR